MSTAIDGGPGDTTTYGLARKSINDDGGPEDTTAYSLGGKSPKTMVNLGILPPIASSTRGFQLERDELAARNLATAKTIRELREREDQTLHVQELESDKLRDTGEIVKRGETNENLREEDERVGETFHPPRRRLQSTVK